jgi:hypothetical protein
MDVHEVKLIDLTTFHLCDRDTCTLHHDKCITDYLQHLFVAKQVIFTEAETILVEQQPPGGLIAVQELIRNEFRDKVTFIPPRSVHVFLSISFYTQLYKEMAYVMRKEWTTTFAEYTMGRWFNLSLVSYERKHDVADSWAQLCYHVCKLNQEWLHGRSKYFIPRDTFRIAVEEAIYHTHMRLSSHTI